MHVGVRLAAASPSTAAYSPGLPVHELLLLAIGLARPWAVTS